MTPLRLDNGRYELQGVVGSGGMALVYRARDRKAKQQVAVKLLADNLAADPELRQRFSREAELAERLDHPNVVRVLDSGETDGRAFIVLEYLEGENLAEELHRVGRLPPARVVELGAQAAAALAHAHARGLVHRDVKPQNLLLSSDGTLKVSDFGIARVVDGTRLTEIGTILGTASYLAPEQAAGGETTGAADVYALGAVLYELVTGEPPYRATSVAELVRMRGEEELEPPSALAREVPVALDSLVLACLREDPAARPTAREVELILRGELAAPTQVLRRPSELPTSFLRRPRRRRLLAGAAAVAALGLAVGLGIGLGGAGGAGKPRIVQARPAPIPSASTPAGTAENLARWLRAHAR